MYRKMIVGVLAALTLGAGLTACSGADAEKNVPTQQPANKPAEKPAEKPAASSPVVEVDGKPVEIKDKQVVCQEAGGNMNIAIGGAEGGVGAVLTSGDSPKVKSVGLGTHNGTAMGWAEGAPGSAKVKKEGNAYEISGKMTAVDMQNPTAPSEKPFRIVVTCS